MVESWFDQPQVRRAPEYEGMGRDAATILAGEEGIDQLRVIEGPGALTADFRPARLNLLIRDDRVVRAAFF